MSLRTMDCASSSTMAARGPCWTNGLAPAVGAGGLVALLIRRPFGLIAGVLVGGAAYALIRRRACQAAVEEREAAIDETLEESFPSSDPPSYSGATS